MVRLIGQEGLQFQFCGVSFKLITTELICQVQEVFVHQNADTGWIFVEELAQATVMLQNLIDCSCIF